MVFVCLCRSHRGISVTSRLFYNHFKAPCCTFEIRSTPQIKLFYPVICFDLLAKLHGSVEVIKQNWVCLFKPLVRVPNRTLQFIITGFHSLLWCNSFSSVWAKYTESCLINSTTEQIISYRKIYIFAHNNGSNSQWLLCTGSAGILRTCWLSQKLSPWNITEIVINEKENASCCLKSLSAFSGGKKSV